MGALDPVAKVMLEREVHGKSHDYVLLFADGVVMDHHGNTVPTTTVSPTNAAGTTDPPPSVRLVHIRHLWQYVPFEIARLFWRCGRRVLRR